MHFSDSTWQSAFPFWQRDVSKYYSVAPLSRIIRCNDIESEFYELLCFILFCSLIEEPHVNSSSFTDANKHLVIIVIEKLQHGACNSCDGFG